MIRASERVTLKRINVAPDLPRQSIGAQITTPIPAPQGSDQLGHEFRCAGRLEACKTRRMPVIQDWRSKTPLVLDGQAEPAARRGNHLPHPIDPAPPADAPALDAALDLLRVSRHAALAYTDAVTQTAGISRIAWGLGHDGTPLTLISALAPHFAALRAQPDCAVMLGEAGPKGDPLTHPRLMIRARADFVAPNHHTRAALRDKWLADHPKAKLYVDFADFAFVRLIPVSALFNGGFGRAYTLSGADLLGI